MTNGFGMIIEMLVAILLMLTIGYCMLLNRRLKLLKADEESLLATISELVTATEIAERAIGGLRLTVDDCEIGLSARLASAERVTAELDRGIAAGKAMLDRITRSASTGFVEAAGVAGGNGAGTSGRQNPTPAPAPRADAKAVAAAAHAFAERLRSKVNGIAA